jgi:hypothetical protein
MRNKHLLLTWNKIITTLLLPPGHIPFTFPCPRGGGPTPGSGFKPGPLAMTGRPSSSTCFALSSLGRGATRHLVVVLGPPVRPGYRLLLDRGPGPSAMSLGSSSPLALTRRCHIPGANTHLMSLGCHSGSPMFRVVAGAGRRRLLASRGTMRRWLG